MERKSSSLQIRRKKKKKRLKPFKGYILFKYRIYSKYFKCVEQESLNGWLLGFLPGKFCLFAGGNPALCCMVRGNCEKALQGCEVAAY